MLLSKSQGNDKAPRLSAMKASKRAANSFKTGHPGVVDKLTGLGLKDTASSSIKAPEARAVINLDKWLKDGCPD